MRNKTGNVVLLTIVAFVALSVLTSNEGVGKSVEFKPQTIGYKTVIKEQSVQEITPGMDIEAIKKESETNKNIILDEANKKLTFKREVKVSELYEYKDGALSKMHTKASGFNGDEEYKAIIDVEQSKVYGTQGTQDLSHYDVEQIRNDKTNGAYISKHYREMKGFFKNGKYSGDTLGVYMNLLQSVRGIQVNQVSTNSSIQVKTGAGDIVTLLTTKIESGDTVYDISIEKMTKEEAQELKTLGEEW